MNKRATIYDISKLLGVSPTTVYKALNGKPKVSEETRESILKTAEKLGYKANIAAKCLARKPIKIGVIIHASFPDFHNEIIRGAKSACEELIDFNVIGEYFTFSGPNCSRKIIDKMEEMACSGFDGIIVSPGVDVRGYAEKISELSHKNVVAATVITDIPESNRVFCVRYDGKLGGRIAAQLLSWLVSTREVAIFTGNSQVLIHRCTVQGFMDEASVRGLEVAGVYENQDDMDIAYYATEKLIRDFPDIGGIYVNSANSVAVCKKVMEKGLEKRIKIITSDIFPELSEYIRKGVVHASIFQDPFRQGRLVFKRLYEYISGDRECKEDIIITPQIVLESNLESFK